MPKLLTRRGARNLTETIDRVASTVQLHAAELGIDPRIALDYAKRSDMVSDAVETTAATNYPTAKGAAPEFAQPPINETGDSVESGDGWDPNAIADDRGGPYAHPADEPYMAGEFAQKQFHELRDKQEAGQISGVDKFSARLAEAEARISAMPDITVQGYDGFTDVIREITPITDQIAELSAAIEAAAGPLLSERAGLEKDYKKKVAEVKKTYKEQLSAIGNITIERKTSLVEARARLKVVAAKRSLTQVQAELLAAVTEKYGEEAANFLKETTSALRDLDKNMRVSIEGFELEQRVISKTGSKEAGLVDVLGKFHDYFDRAWKKLKQMANSALSVIQGAARRMSNSHDDFIDVLDDISSGKIAAKESKKASGPDVINIFA